LANQLNKVKLQSHLKLASFDVVSLFTNIPIDLVKESLKRRWNDISKGTKIPLNEFLRGVDFVLNSTFFKFDNTVYKQIFGTPMGSPLSPIVAEIVLRDLEEHALNKLSFHIPLYYRYVDDILIAIPYDRIDETLRVFNSLHERVKFTSETNNENYINFLNLRIGLENNGNLSLNLFSKPTSSGRFLNYFSNHPLAQKRGIIYGMVDKILLLSDPELHENNLKSTIKILLNNSYPLKFIFTTIRNRIKYHLYKQNHNNTNNKKDMNSFPYFLIPYMKNFSKPISNFLSNVGFNISYKCSNKLNSFIKTNKDPLSHAQKSNLVYKIQCNDCNAAVV